MSGSDATAGAALLRVVIDSSREIGLPVDAILTEVGLEPSVLADPDARVQRRLVYRIWELLGDRSGDPAFGLHLAERHVRPGAFGLLEYAARTSPTLGHAYQHVVRFARLMVDSVEAIYEPHGDTIHIGCRILDPRLPPQRYAAECAIAALVLIGRQISGVEWRPTEVWFQHGTPADTSEHRRIFGAPIRFDAKLNGFAVDRALLSRPLPDSDPALNQLMGHYGEQALGRLPAGAAFTERVRSEIARACATGEASVGHVARRLHVSPRTLQRRLADEGTSLKAVLDEVRREIALTCLRDRGMHAGEVAALLGFSDSSAFHRAFRRWTGVAPSTIRKGSVSS
jgi:AraC-like DNA-binding protein